MKRFLFIFITVTIFLQTPVWAETIHYSLKAGVKIGEAQLSLLGPKVYRGQETLLIVFKSKGIGFIDEENIYLNPKTYRPLFVERTYNKEKIFEEYLNDAHEIKVTKTVGKRITNQVIKKKNAADNIYGFIYRYRKEGSFQIDDILQLNLPTKDLKIQLVKREPIMVSGQNYNTYYMQSKPSKYKIWFDASEKKIPLRISGPLGTMTMTLYAS